MNARLYGKRTGTTINDITTLGTTNTNNDTNTPTPFIKDWPSQTVTSSPINDVSTVATTSMNYDTGHLTSSLIKYITPLESLTNYANNNTNSKYSLLTKIA